jgi:hypothetical protein
MHSRIQQLSTRPCESAQTQPTQNEQDDDDQAHDPDDSVHDSHPLATAYNPFTLALPLSQCASERLPKHMPRSCAPPDAEHRREYRQVPRFWPGSRIGLIVCSWRATAPTLYRQCDRLRWGDARTNGGAYRDGRGRHIGVSRHAIGVDTANRCSAAGGSAGSRDRVDTTGRARVHFTGGCPTFVPTTGSREQQCFQNCGWYDMLLLKVLALVQDADPPPAQDIVRSRSTNWEIFADPRRFIESNLMAGVAR